MRSWLGPMTFLGALAIWLLASWAAMPRPPEQIVLTGDTTIVAATGDGGSITILVPLQGDKPVTQAAIAPFSLGPLQPTVAAADGRAQTLAVSRANLTLPASGAAPGEYLAAVIGVGDQQRKITVKLAAPPWGPTLAVLGGLGLAYYATRWRTFGRRSTLLRANAAELLEDVALKEPGRGDLNGDQRPEFSVMNSMAALIGTGIPPEAGSVLALSRNGDLDGAEKRLGEARKLVDDFVLFIAEGRVLRELHETAVVLFPSSTTQPAIVQQGNVLFDPHSPTRQVAKETLAVEQQGLKDLIAAYRTLLPVGGRLLAAERAMENLRRTNPGSWPNNEHQESFRRADEQLKREHAALWASRTADDIKAVSTGVGEALKAIDTLSAAHLPHLDMIDISSYAAPSDVTPGPEPIWRRALQATATQLRDRVVVADWLLLMIGVLIATTTALTVLYAGRAFGTPLDYLGAFLWGVGVEQAVKGLSGVLEKLGVPAALGAAGSAPKAS